MCIILCTRFLNSLSQHIHQRRQLVERLRRVVLAVQAHKGAEVITLRPGLLQILHNSRRGEELPGLDIQGGGDAL